MLQWDNAAPIALAIRTGNLFLHELIERMKRKFFTSSTETCRWSDPVGIPTLEHGNESSILEIL
jgi:hypothetical protein